MEEANKLPLNEVKVLPTFYVLGSHKKLHGGSTSLLPHLLPWKQSSLWKLLVEVMEVGGLLWKRMAV